VGLVVSLPIAMICTFWLQRSTGPIAGTLVIEIGATLLALALVFLPWSRLPASLLLIFPGILAATLISTAHLDRSKKRVGRGVRCSRPTSGIN
jgi:hypothetical protein